MGRYIAFLRAINVGGRTVRMDELREAFEGLGFESVSTFIASGNVIFDARSRSAAALETKIEKHLEKVFGFEVGTFLRTADELIGVGAREPFAGDATDAEGARVTEYVVFMRDAPPRGAAKKLADLCTDIDTLHIDGREIHWRCRGGMMDTTVPTGALEKIAGGPVTMRNHNTVMRILAKYC
jgi:uncharacterized protein (DUF1697 family)